MRSPGNYAEFRGGFLKDVALSLVQKTYWNWERHTWGAKALGQDPPR